MSIIVYQFYTELILCFAEITATEYVLSRKELQQINVRYSMGQSLIKKLIVVRFVFTTVLMQVQVWWDATSLQLANSYLLFRAACFLYIQGQLSKDGGSKLFRNVSSQSPVHLESCYRASRSRECQYSPLAMFLLCHVHVTFKLYWHQLTVGKCSYHEERIS